MSVMYNEYVGAWTLLYCSAYGGMLMRSAPNPWGPWSNSVQVAYIGGSYAPFMNPLYVADGGKTIYFTMSQWDPYDVYLAKATINIAPTTPAPTITIDWLSTNDATPMLTGTVSDPAATVNITVNSKTYTAVNNGSTWTLADNIISPALATGVYSITAKATDTSGHVGTDYTNNELAIDATAPTVDIVDIAPDPRTVPVSAASIVFSEPVTGFDLADLTLTRDGEAVSLEGATLTTNGNITWTLNIASQTTPVGVYNLTLTAGGSGLTDLAGNALVAGASDSWTTIPDVIPPTVYIVDVSPDPRTTSVSSISIVFSEPVNGFDLGDLTLSARGVLTPLTGATLTTKDNITWTLANLANLTKSCAMYVLTLNSEDSDIVDLGGNPLVAGDTETWALTATVQLRRIFYNNSYLDSNLSDPNADDKAIDNGKKVLLPGGIATADNITGYGKGINGIIVDIFGMINPAGLSADDFAVRIGTSSDLGAWSAGPAPDSVNVRQGAGVSGSDRVTIVWEDRAIKATWMELTILANLNTGLSSPDVFYVGNLPADLNSDGAVNVQDLSMLGTNFRMPATTVLEGDVNLDTIVNVQDLAIMGTFYNSQLPMLDLTQTMAAQPAPMIVAADGETNLVSSDVTPAPASILDAPVVSQSSEAMVLEPVLAPVLSLASSLETKATQLSADDILTSSYPAGQGALPELSDGDMLDLLGAGGKLELSTL
jgi:hypothetical protein